MPDLRQSPLDRGTAGVPVRLAYGRAMRFTHALAVAAFAVMVSACAPKQELTLTYFTIPG